MKCARPRERNAEGGSLEDPTGDHMNTPHTSQGRDVEGQDDDGELSQREGREIEGREGWVLLVTNAPLVDQIRACDPNEPAPARTSSNLAA